MLDRSNLTAFLATTDASRTRAFYEGVLGLRFVSDEPFALVYDAQGTELRIQKVERFTPQPHTALGWSVASLQAVMREIVARGGRFERYPALAQDEAGVWLAPSGTRIAWLKDPDGNVLSLAEKPQV